MHFSFGVFHQQPTNLGQCHTPSPHTRVYNQASESFGQPVRVPLLLVELCDRTLNVSTGIMPIVAQSSGSPANSTPSLQTSAPLTTANLAAYDRLMLDVADSAIQRWLADRGNVTQHDVVISTWAELVTRDPLAADIETIVQNVNRKAAK